MVKITFINTAGEELVLDAQRGISVMQVATSNGLRGIDAECGGLLSCATCHVYLDEAWYPKVRAPEEAEQSMLEFAEGPQATSRLSCQIKVSDELDGLIVRIPETQ